MVIATGLQVYWGLTPLQQPGSYQGGAIMTMKSVIWWRKPEYPEETTDLRQVTDELHYICVHGLFTRKKGYFMLLKKTPRPLRCLLIVSMPTYRHGVFLTSPLTDFRRFFLPLASVLSCLCGPVGAMCPGLKTVTSFATCGMRFWTDIKQNPGENTLTDSLTYLRSLTPDEHNVGLCQIQRLESGC